MVIFDQLIIAIAGLGGLGAIAVACLLAWDFMRLRKLRPSCCMGSACCMGWPSLPLQSELPRIGKCSRISAKDTMRDLLRYLTALAFGSLLQVQTNACGTLTISTRADNSFCLRNKINKNLILGLAFSLISFPVNNRLLRHHDYHGERHNSTRIDTIYNIDNASILRRYGIDAVSVLYR